MWLPLDTAVPARAAAAEGKVLQGLRVLLVDDTVDALESFGELLGLFGVEVTAATSGAEALALAEMHSFDLIISDIGMPGMDGYDLMQRLREVPAHATVPSIALTGFGRPGDRQRAQKAGYSSHLAKPVALETLLETVARIVPAR